MSQDIFGEVIVIKRNGSDGARFPFRTSHCIFGRNQECDIRIQLPNVAQEHAKLYVEQGKVLLQNLSDGAPTLLNKEEIQKQELKHKDVFTITERSFRFELPERRKSSTGRRSSSSKKTPLKALQGSPRTPAAGESLKKSIKKLRKTSSVVEEDDETQIPSTPECPKMCKENTPEDELLQTTPSILKKRKSITTGSRKRVSFGSSLSPELFDKRLPPSTPLRRGKSPSRRLSEPLQKTTPNGRGKKRCSVGTVLREMPVVEEEEECKADSPLTSSVGRPSMPVNEMPLHVAGLHASTPFSKEEKIHAVADELSLIPIEEEEEEGKEDDPTTYSDEKPDRHVDETPLQVGMLADTPPQNLPSPLISTITEEVKASNLPNVDKALKHKLATPIRENIQQGVSLRATKKKLASPLRKEINKGLTLKSTRQKMHTPLRKEIHARPQLRKNLQKSTPGKKGKRRSSVSAEVDEIPLVEEGEDGKDNALCCAERPRMPVNEIPLHVAVLEVTPSQELQAPLDFSSVEEEEAGESTKIDETLKRKLATPIRENIQLGVSLRATKKKLATPLRNEIKRGLTLKSSRQKLATPLRQQIRSGAALKATRQKMHTPLRKEIHSRRKSQKMLKKIATPLRKEILARPELKATKRKLATPLRKDIKKGVNLMKTKPSMATELQEEIKSKPQLKATMKKLATPLRKQIKDKPKLNATKKIMATPLRAEIKTGLKLRATKRRLATPLRKDIETGLELKTRKRKLATPLRKDIQKGVNLMKTKPSMAPELQEEIKSKPQLKATMKKLATPLRNDIQKGVNLFKTKPSMATDLQEEIKSKPQLKATMKKLATPLRKQIKDKPKLNATKKIMATPLRAEIKTGLKLRATKQKLATPLRKEIESAPKLKETKKHLPNDLQSEIINGKELKKIDAIMQQQAAPVGVKCYSKDTGKTKQPPKKRICRRSTPQRMVQLRQQVMCHAEKAVNNEEVQSEQTTVEHNSEMLSTPKSNASQCWPRLSNSSLSQSDYNDMSPVIALEPVFVTKEQERRISLSVSFSSSSVSETSGEEEDFEKDMPSFTELLASSGAEECVGQDVEESDENAAELKGSPLAKSSAVEEKFGLTRLFKTPKDKACAKSAPVEENFGLVRLLKTPNNKTSESNAVTEHFGLRRLMQTPRIKNAEDYMPVEENFGLQRLMKTPKDKGKADPTEVEEHFGLKRLMKTPKNRSVKRPASIEGDFGIDVLMKSPEALEEDGIETPSLDGLILVSKMPIHSAEEGAAEVATEEESIDVSDHPALFESPKHIEPQATDLSLQPASGRPKISTEAASTPAKSDTVSQEEHEAQGERTASIEGDFGIDVLMKNLEAIEEDGVETPSLDGLILVSKMPIHSAEEAAAEAATEEESIDVGDLPALFKSPKDVQAQAQDLSLQPKRGRPKKSSGAASAQAKSETVSQEEHETEEEAVLKRCADETMGKDNSIAAAPSRTRSTRSSGRKSIEHAVQRISQRITKKTDKEDDDNSLTVIKPRQAVKGRRKSTRKNAPEIKNQDTTVSLAGVAKGVAVTPPKVCVSKTKLHSIPEESEMNLKTPAHSSLSSQDGGDRNRRTATTESEDSVMQITATQNVQPTGRPTRRTRRSESGPSFSEEKVIAEQEALQKPHVLVQKIQPISRRSRRTREGTSDAETVVAEHEQLQKTEFVDQQKTEVADQPSTRRSRRVKKSEIKTAETHINVVDIQEPSQVVNQKCEPVARRSTRSKKSELETSSEPESAVVDQRSPQEMVTSHQEVKPITRRSRRAQKSEGKTSHNVEDDASVEVLIAVAEQQMQPVSSKSKRASKSKAKKPTDVTATSGVGRRATRSTRSNEDMSEESASDLALEVIEEKSTGTESVVTSVTMKRKRPTSAKSLSVEAENSTDIDDCGPQTKRSKRSVTREPVPVVKRLTRSTRSRR